MNAHSLNRALPRRFFAQVISFVLLAFALFHFSSARAAVVFAQADNGSHNLFGTLNLSNGQFTQIAQTTPLFFGLTSGAGGQIIGADSASEHLFTVTAAGATKQYGSVAAPAQFNGIAYSQSAGNFFADNVDTNSVKLYSIAGDGSSLSPIGQMLGPNAGIFPTGGLAFGPGGKLYFNYSTDKVNAINSKLYTVDTSSGAITPIGNSLGTVILVLLSDGTTLYGIDTFSSSNIGIYTINTSTGVATRISTITGLASGYFLDAATFSTAQLLNISTRMEVLTGDNVLIGGFIITGSQNKRVLLRGIGPSLGSKGVSGALSDPTLEVHGNGAIIAANDDWQTTIIGGQITADQRGDIAASGAPPSDSHESAIILNLAPGAYTAILRGKNGATGVGLVEAYDLARTAPSLLANISTRGFVDTGDNVMIGGFIAGSATGGSAHVLIRAIGPSLSVNNRLADPILELHDSNGASLAANDNWRDTQPNEIQNTGIPPKNDLESALIENLAPGNYTAIVRGKGNTTGVGLVEFYNLQ
jgi:hypothetical protein